MNKQKLRKQKQYRTLISVLAAGSTPEARKLVKNTTGQDTTSEIDLEEKLADIYANSTSKLDLEKEFANIHPHKEFILKYCQPTMPVDLGSLNTANTEVVKQVEITTPARPVQNPTEGTSCASCGVAYSSADGGGGQSPRGSYQLTIVVLGLVSIVAIAGTIIYLKQRNA